VVAATPTKDPSPLKRHARRRSVAAASVAAATALLLAGCGGGGSSSNGDRSHATEQQALRAYVSTIEPLRLRVDKLLDGADPILAGYHDHALTLAQAQRGMRRIEQRFAGYRAEVAAVKPVPPDLVAAHRAYAHTYAQEDAYLRALIAAMPRRDWSTLPHTVDAQRRALVAWRAALALEAARVGVPIPADIDIAGRDEIAPSPDGNS
jgi:hypothetical protein